MPTLYFNSNAPGVAASGLIVLPHNPNDGDTFTLYGTVFTFWNSDDPDPPPGILIDTVSGPAILNPNTIDAINGAALGATASFDSGSNGCAIVNNSVGTAGNVAITTNNPTNVTVTGMSGGVNAGAANGSYATLANFWNDSGNTSPAAAVPLSTTDVIIQDPILRGTGVAKSLTDAGTNVCTGGTITVYGSCSVLSLNGMVVQAPPTGGSPVIGSSVVRAS